jgi:hypothetical protein
LRAFRFSTSGSQPHQAGCHPGAYRANGHRAFKAEEHREMASWHAWKYRTATALLLGAASSGALAGSTGPTLSVVATPNAVVVGAPLTLNVLINGIADLYAYQFSLAYDPALLQLNSVNEGPFLVNTSPTFFDGGSINNGAGTVSFVFATLIGAVPGVTGGGTLASLQFTTVAAGVSALTFSDVLLLNSAQADITVTALNGSVQLTAAVPEPASYALFALGLAGLAVAAQRRAKAAA